MPGMSQETAPATAGQFDDFGAQAVPSATLHRRAALRLAGERRGHLQREGRLWLDSDRAGPRGQPRGRRVLPSWSGGKCERPLVTDFSYFSYLLRRQLTGSLSLGNAALSLANITERIRIVTYSTLLTTSKIMGHDG